MVSTVADSSSPCSLRSARTTNYVHPRLCTKFGERGLSLDGPGSMEMSAERGQKRTPFERFRHKLKTRF